MSRGGSRIRCPGASLLLVLLLLLSLRYGYGDLLMEVLVVGVVVVVREM